MFSLADEIVLLHNSEDHISAFSAIFRVFQRTVGGWRFQHTDKHGYLLWFQLGGSSLEIDSGCRFNPESIVAEVNGIQIQSYNIFFRIVHLNFKCAYPFLEFHNNDPHVRNVTKQSF
ncbi:hypothetical protein SDC9_103780 [bioreactor metagenome]|uniref:Uncharacterized protein n=1 Tax=bioreactor metagenome TaxID=1076179 RepID=A0A645B1C5_9ZZZZ